MKFDVKLKIDFKSRILNIRTSKVSSRCAMLSRVGLFLSKIAFASASSLSSILWKQIRAEKANNVFSTEPWFYEQETGVVT